MIWEFQGTEWMDTVCSPLYTKEGIWYTNYQNYTIIQAFLRISVVDTLRFQWKGFLVGWISIQLWNEANRSAISLDIIECFVCQCVRAAHPPTIIGHSSRVVQLVKGVAPMALRDCKHNLRASWWPPDSYPPNLLWRWWCLDLMRWAELDYSGSWKKTDE